MTAVYLPVRLRDPWWYILRLARDAKKEADPSGQDEFSPSEMSTKADADKVPARGIVVGPLKPVTYARFIEHGLIAFVGSKKATKLVRHPGVDGGVFWPPSAPWTETQETWYPVFTLTEQGKNWRWPKNWGSIPRPLRDATGRADPAAKGASMPAGPTGTPVREVSTMAIVRKDGIIVLRTICPKCGKDCGQSDGTTLNPRVNQLAFDVPVPSSLSDDDLILKRFDSCYDCGRDDFAKGLFNIRPYADMDKHYVFADELAKLVVDTRARLEALEAAERGNEN